MGIAIVTNCISFIWFVNTSARFVCALLYQPVSPYGWCCCCPLLRLHWQPHPLKQSLFSLYICECKPECFPYAFKYILTHTQSSFDNGPHLFMLKRILFIWSSVDGATNPVQILYENVDSLMYHTIRWRQRHRVEWSEGEPNSFPDVCLQSQCTIRNQATVNQSTMQMGSVFVESYTPFMQSIAVNSPNCDNSRIPIQCPASIAMHKNKNNRILYISHAFLVTMHQFIGLKSIITQFSRWTYIGKRKNKHAEFRNWIHVELMHSKQFLAPKLK